VGDPGQGKSLSPYVRILKMDLPKKKRMLKTPPENFWIRPVMKNICPKIIFCAIKVYMEWCVMILSQIGLVRKFLISYFYNVIAVSPAAKPDILIPTEKFYLKIFLLLLILVDQGIRRVTLAIPCKSVSRNSRWRPR
jgi:hypothetical protein